MYLGLRPKPRAKGACPLTNPRPDVRPLGAALRALFPEGGAVASTT